MIVTFRQYLRKNTILLINITMTQDKTSEWHTEQQATSVFDIIIQCINILQIQLSMCCIFHGFISCFNMTLHCRTKRRQKSCTRCRRSRGKKRNTKSSSERSTAANVNLASQSRRQTNRDFYSVMASSLSPPCWFSCWHYLSTFCYNSKQIDVLGVLDKC